MTTIAYRDGRLAFDSLASINSIRSGYVTKAYRIKGCLVVGAGAFGSLQQFRAWVSDGMNGQAPELREGDQMVLVAPDGRVLEYESSGWIWVRSPYYAWGSGWELAMGAMDMGASAYRAVQVAAARDLHSGGPIRQLCLEGVAA